MRSALISVSYCATDASTFAISVPAGVDRSRPSLRLMRLTLSGLELVEQRRQAARGTPQSIEPPHDDGVDLAHFDVAHEPLERGPVHRLARLVVDVELWMVRAWALAQRSRSGFWLAVSWPRPLLTRK